MAIKFNSSTEILKPTTQNSYLQTTSELIIMLEQSKSLIEGVTDDISDLFMIIDSKMIVQRGNKALASLMELTMHSVVGRSCGSLFSEERMQTFRGYLDSVFRTDIRRSNTVKFETEIQPASGKAMIVSWVIQALPKPFPESSQLAVVIGRDVTDLKRKEDKLRRLSEQLELELTDKTRDVSDLLSSVDQGIFTIDTELNLVGLQSRRFYEMFSPGENRDMKTILKLSPEEADNFKAWVDLIASPNRTKNWQRYHYLCPLKEFAMTTKDGTKHFMFDFFPIIADGQSFSQLMLLCTDVTSRVAIGDKIAGLKSDVKNRTQDLVETREKVIQAAKWQALGEMASGVAHEINNPLTIISSSAHILQDTKGLSAEKTADLHDNLAVGISRISMIVQQLIRFTSADKAEDQEVFTIDTLIENTLNFCAERLRLEGVTLKTKLSAKVSVEGNLVTLVEAILNLVNNASDAMKKSEDKTLTIVTAADPETRSVKIMVKDTGVGVSDSIAKTMFDPFTSTKTQMHSVGMGLSSAKNIVESFGGQISFENGAETVFTVTLPAN